MSEIKQQKWPQIRITLIRVRIYIKVKSRIRIEVERPADSDPVPQSSNVDPQPYGSAEPFAQTTVLNFELYSRFCRRNAACTAIYPFIIFNFNKDFKPFRALIFQKQLFSVQRVLFCDLFLLHVLKWKLYNSQCMLHGWFECFHFAHSMLEWMYSTMPVAFFGPYRLNILTYVIGAGGGRGRAIYMMISLHTKSTSLIFFTNLLFKLKNDNTPWTKVPKDMMLAYLKPNSWTYNFVESSYTHEVSVLKHREGVWISIRFSSFLLYSVQ